MARPFTGDLAFLSNFHPSPFEYRDRQFPTAEHAFQWAKVTDRETKLAIEAAPKPGQAKRLGRKGQMRADWEAVKIGVMTDILHAKFRDNPDMARQLVVTGDEELVEINNWNDTFWGQCRGKGKNNLGKCLMQVRDELRP